MGNPIQNDLDPEGGVLTDASFAPFRAEDFSVAQFTSKVLTGSHTSAQSQSEQLKQGLQIVDAEIAKEVATQPDLIKNVRRMLDAERALGDVVLSVESLQSAIRRIRAEITGPYEHIRHRTQQLKNLHATVELLRHLIHRIKLTQKLRAQMAASPGSLDLAKAAKLLTDIAAVDRESDLTGIDVAAVDNDFIRESKLTVRDQVQAMLQEGMESMSQAKVGSALQVYFNLDELQQAVKDLISSHLNKLEKQAKAAMDARQLTAGAGPHTLPTTSLMGMHGSAAAAGNASWQEKLWSGLKTFADSLASSAAAVWHLQRVVAKKKDPMTHVCFLDVLVQPDQPLLTQQFWSAVVVMLSEVFAGVAKPGSKTGSVRDTLVAGYPKLASTFETMFDRLTSDTTMKGVSPAVEPEQLQQLLAATAPIQSAYLANSLSRMSDAVVTAFPGGSRPLTTPAEVHKCISVLHEELRSCSQSPQMAAMVARTAGKALELLAEKAEYMAATGPDMKAITVSTPANPNQLRNILLASQLYEVQRSLASLTTKLPPAAAQALTIALDALQATAVECVSPMFKAMAEMVELKILKIHSISYSRTSEGGVTTTSPCVAEAAALITHFRSEFLSKFVPPPSPTSSSCVGSLVERMAARVLLFYIRHVCLVRPLSQVGRLQVAKDLAELQLAVSAGLYPVEHLGPPHRVVKAFRGLLFQDQAAILASTINSDLPPSIIAHHIFTRLPVSIQAPHERSGLSASQYSRWLDTHSSQEVLRGVASALEDQSAAAGQLGPEDQELISVILHLCKQHLQ